MRDDGGIAREDRKSPAGHVGLAVEVINRLASLRRAGVGKLQQPILDQLVTAVCLSDPDAVTQVLEDFRAARIGPDAVTTEYIPAAARALGVAWEEDRLTFGMVTIGTARLQAMLRQLQQDLRADAADPVAQSAVLVLIPPGEQHTLGPMVAAAILRRNGVSVSVQISPDLDDMSQMLANRRFNAALVTLGSIDRVETCVKLVKTLKQTTKGALRVAIGGAVVDECRDELTRAGADLLTNDVETVISEFGLNEQTAERNAW
jgi:MerR family transcriptional regulator, light-induced transcriptional regulator